MSALTALVSGTLAFADPPGAGPHGMGHGRDHGMGGMPHALGKGPARPRFQDLWRLDLDDDTRRKINAIHDALHKRHWETKGRIHDQQVRLRELYEVEPYDARKIGAAHAEIGKLRAQMIEAEVDALNRAIALLSPEQKTRLKELASAPSAGAAATRVRAGTDTGR